MNKTILLVDDEIEITEINCRYLSQEGYTVHIAHNGAEALELYKKESIALIITDIMMPIMDGYDLMSEVQAITPDQPFLFITAKTSDMDKIYSLSLGADDFISKPFSPRELVLRVNNILRRIHRHQHQEDHIQVGDLKINQITHQAFIQNKELNLTNKEFDLLWILLSNPQRVFSKTELYDRVWQEEYIDDTNTLNVHIHGLRNALAKYATSETPTIKTVWGLGYKLEV
ncbi:response regulator [Streptococcus sp. zg-86]|uniref:Response regulator n=1 Tax=Streptococcus zhangguiae TaxID=2664091 RepID=A0A6I4RB25_9STRE|nr:MULTISPECIES: response regulator transcription factor [unclassified Streptococcus]MTB64597.1 response regulator [Streptococcus sp. zg-86]MTB90907.1 response regulator [Streptococcus sp. zg-36]MWV56669.1 response regulator [Streptococcus sp. zg-70]QTH48627.1 response regulator transcription factor [Streptococcus sp. zg-86]